MLSQMAELASQLKRLSVRILTNVSPVRCSRLLAGVRAQRLSIDLCMWRRGRMWKAHVAVTPYLVQDAAHDDPDNDGYHKANVAMGQLIERLCGTQARGRNVHDHVDKDALGLLLASRHGLCLW